MKAFFSRSHLSIDKNPTKTRKISSHPKHGGHAHRIQRAHKISQRQNTQLIFSVQFLSFKSSIVLWRLWHSTFGQVNSTILLFFLSIKSYLNIIILYFIRINALWSRFRDILGYLSQNLECELPWLLRSIECLALVFYLRNTN